MICVSSKPEAPTVPPSATRRRLFIAMPAMASATPEQETKRDIVIGISAPPTRIANAIPKNPLMSRQSMTLTIGVKDGIQTMIMVAIDNTSEIVVIA